MDQDHTSAGPALVQQSQIGTHKKDEELQSLRSELARTHGNARRLEAVWDRLTILAPH